MGFWVLKGVILVLDPAQKRTWLVLPESETAPSARNWQDIDVDALLERLRVFVTGVRASVDRQALAEALGFTSDKRITVAQSVGFPKK